MLTCCINRHIAFFTFECKQMDRRNAGLEIQYELLENISDLPTHSSLLLKSQSTSHLVFHFTMLELRKFVFAQLYILS